ncbi:ribosomal protein L1 [Calocera viscosa TUFC12733]|uniref:Ribosomal L1 domain-containing protein 1 n=1 Tax=Calocera viscosa (strain TUFC12733) TaxID=1330018 RepID=A0A167MA98_CALVF|nr:ribosomal protein L1 [Calocera viscosa TUFC12733]
MVAQLLIEDRVSQKQALTAAKALLTHTSKHREELEEQNLLPPKEDHVWLVVATKRIPRSFKVKPIKIPLVHPVIDPRETSICLLTKDPQREYKDLIDEQKINFISRVVGVTKLKEKHKPFEARRQLLKDHGLFLADQRIVPLLPALLGKMFFDAKKQPVPVDLTAKDLKAELARAVSSTYMHQNAGTCVSIKIGTVSHTPDQVIANLTSALPAIVKNIEGGWENVLSLSVKTARSTSLPVWSCELEERFNVPSLDAARQEALDKKAKEKPKGKGKKRKADEVDGVAGDENSEKSAKKAKDGEDVEEDDDEFGGFGGFDDVVAEGAETIVVAEDDEPAAPPPKTKKAPSKAKSKKPPVDEAEDLEPLSLVSSGTKTATGRKVKTKKTATDESTPVLSSPKPVEKLDKASKKGASVQQLQKKMKSVGKETSLPSAKRKVLGKKRLEE